MEEKDEMMEPVDLEQDMVDRAVNAETPKEAKEATESWAIIREQQMKEENAEHERKLKQEKHEAELKAMEAKTEHDAEMIKVEKAKARNNLIGGFIGGVATILGGVLVAFIKGEYDLTYQGNDQVFEENGNIAINHSKRRRPR